MRNAVMFTRAVAAHEGSGAFCRSQNVGIGCQSEIWPFLARNFTSKRKRPAKPSIGSGLLMSVGSKRGRK